MTITRTTGSLMFLSLLALSFLLDGAAMRQVAMLPEWVVTIAGEATVIGNSAWLGITLPLIAISAAVTMQSRASEAARGRASLVLKLCVAIFLSVLLSGVAVQILKHGFGRARPEWFGELGAFAWRPYAFDFSFNSFPSGHATTLGAVGFFLLRLFPRQWRLIAAFGVLGGATRIVTQQHYPSDVVAGLGLGLATSWALCRALALRGQLPVLDGRTVAPLAARARLGWRRMTQRRPGTRRPRVDGLYLSLLIGTLIALNAAIMLFLAAPRIDLAVSGLFHDGRAAFPMAQSEALNAVRHVFMRGTQLVALGSLILYLGWLRLGSRLQIPRAVPFYATACFALGPALLVNGVFKSYWGRARPDAVEQFGGMQRFTLPFERADQCLSNCSFPSGEGAGIAMLAILAATLCWPWLRGRKRVMAAGAGLALFGIGLRVAMGRHFLSDSVFSVLLMALTALLIWRICDMGRHRPALRMAAIRHDSDVVRNYLSGPARDGASLSGDARTVTAACWHVLRIAGSQLRALASALDLGSAGLLPPRNRPLRMGSQP
ncbi:PAP2 superfamily protein [Paracoccus isoporae]|uniref:PAP2 superfamily protein n=1 Tax=Paracoccus isoporae TaxID=591205 RepID=A0A1G6ZE21_9RHOB|nr:phosphatase PAP2 family protein [Paracoccus isoporae]SDE00864.1 PAP2 superfamily protein [Paracoccus isoporae]